MLLLLIFKSKKMKFRLLLFSFILSLTSYSQPPSYVPTDNLLAWYPFNGSSLDESFNGNNGVNNGGISMSDDRFGNASSAQLFDGVPLTYINCGNDPMLNITSGGNLTVSAWVKSDNPGGTNTIVSKSSSYLQNVYGSYQLIVITGTPIFVITNEGGNPDWYVVAAGSQALSPGTWHFITGTVDSANSRIRLYVDGALVDSKPWTGTFDSNLSSDLLIGSHYKAGFGSDYMYNFNGDLDDIGLWGRVLSQCELLDLYTAGMSVDLNQNDTELNATQTGATYQWLDCDNDYASILDETDQFYTPSLTGNYAVEVQMNGCIDTSACLLVDYTGIEDLIQKEKELVKIVDLMGRETQYKPNTPLIFMYSDGTKERVLQIEE